MKNDQIVQEKYDAILTTYNLFWKQYSAAIVNIDEKFHKLNKLVNVVY